MLQNTLDKLDNIDQKNNNASKQQSVKPMTEKSHEDEERKEVPKPPVLGNKYDFTRGTPTDPNVFQKRNKGNESFYRNIVLQKLVIYFPLNKHDSC